ncbi:hypothetical protein GCM10009657_31870 [Oryzihumus leptocrescens]
MPSWSTVGSNVCAVRAVVAMGSVLRRERVFVGYNGDGAGVLPAKVQVGRQARARVCP